MSDEQKTKQELTKDLAKSEQVFRLLVQGVTDYAIFMLDPQGTVVTWNEGAERIHGYTADEVIGQNFSTFYVAEGQESHVPELQLATTIKKGRYEGEGWRVRKDGSRIWANVVITAIYDSGSLVGFANVIRDLTERKISEQREELFSLLVNNVRDYAVYLVSPEGTIMTWNEGAQRIKGWTAEEVIGKNFSMFYTKEAIKRKHPERDLELARENGRHEEESWRVRKDGTLIWASVVLTAVFEDGNLRGYAKVTRDLTQRLLADQEREMSAKLLDESNNELQRALDVKSRFLSTISHEVRTPMTAIIGMTEILTSEDLGEDNNLVVQHIFDASQRLLQLLNNLLDSARIETGELNLEYRKFPVRAVVGDIRQLIDVEATRKHLRITGNVDSAIPEYITGDELKLRQILLNLSHNAVKFTLEGSIDISARLTTFKTSENQSAAAIRFTITDTGIGIKEEHASKLFEPFVQAEDSTKRVYGGTGLGLSISRQLVEAMGGTIGFDTKFGDGSTFWFELPLLEEVSK